MITTQNNFQTAKRANSTPAPTGAEREKFIREAVRRAEEAGLYPARFQRPVDWDAVAFWATRAVLPGFAWRAAEPWSADAIVVGPRAGGRGRVVHSGQHRILGGLVAGNPVPESLVGHIGIEDAGRGWREPIRAWSLDELLGL